jgi:hypothetical protein
MKISFAALPTACVASPSVKAPITPPASGIILPRLTAPLVPNFVTRRKPSGHPLELRFDELRFVPVLDDEVLRFGP